MGSGTHTRQRTALQAHMVHRFLPGTSGHGQPLGSPLPATPAPEVRTSCRLTCGVSLPPAHRRTTPRHSNEPRSYGRTIASYHRVQSCLRGGVQHASVVGAQHRRTYTAIGQPWSLAQHAPFQSRASSNQQHLRPVCRRTCAQQAAATARAKSPCVRHLAVAARRCFKRDERPCLGSLA